MRGNRCAPGHPRTRVRSWISREQLITATSSPVPQMRDLLDCVWPAVLDTAKQPFRSATWIAALTAVVERDGGDLARTRRLGWTRFETAIRRLIVQAGRAEVLSAHRPPRVHRP
jgi:hypothetical protein